MAYDRQILLQGKGRIDIHCIYGQFHHSRFFPFFPLAAPLIGGRNRRPSPTRDSVVLVTGPHHRISFAMQPTVVDTSEPAVFAPLLRLGEGNRIQSVTALLASPAFLPTHNEKSEIILPHNTITDYTWITEITHESPLFPSERTHPAPCWPLCILAYSGHPELFHAPCAHCEALASATGIHWRSTPRQTPQRCQPVAVLARSTAHRPPLSGPPFRALAGSSIRASVLLDRSSVPHFRCQISDCVPELVQLTVPGVTIVL